jgi:hypothetical protein
MRDVVGAFEVRRMGETQFRSDFDLSVRDVASLVPKFPAVVWNPLAPEVGLVRHAGLPPVGSPPVRFRLPSLAEIESSDAWVRYRDQRRRFYEAYGLYNTGELRGAFEGRLQMSIKDLERQAIQRLLSGLQTGQEDLIKALAR